MLKKNIDVLRFLEGYKMIAILKSIQYNLNLIFRIILKINLMKYVTLVFFQYIVLNFENVIGFPLTHSLCGNVILTLGQTTHTGEFPQKFGQNPKIKVTFFHSQLCIIAY